MVEKGTIPASSQGLPTSRILETTALHLEHLIFTLSIQGLWGECSPPPPEADGGLNSSQPSSALFCNSSFEPITSKFLHSEHS